MLEGHATNPVTAPATSAESALASLAYINVTWETSRASYLDNFVPFLLEALRVQGGPTSATEAQLFIRSRFGLDLPVGVVVSLTDRAVRVRKVRRIPQAKGVVQLADGVADTLPDLGALQGECRRQQGHLVRALVSFAQERFGVEWHEPAAEDALLTYIESKTVRLMETAVRGVPWPNDGTSHQREYVVSSFIADIADHDPTSFNYLDQMIKGSMLSAVLYVEPTGQVNRKFKHTTIYLDTAICLRALGLEGTEAKSAAQAMLVLALTQGAELACFVHTVREIKGVLYSARDALRSGRATEYSRSGVTRHLQDSGAAPADVDLMIARLETDLEASRIRIRDTPPFAAHLGVDEAALENVLQERVRYREGRARITDLNSLTAIHRIRYGQSDVHLETCRAVFVTNNHRLVSAGRIFFDSTRHGWPLAMMDSTLTTLLWVKAPNSMPDLPRSQVVADCYSALAPSPTLWSKFLHEIDRLEQRGMVDADSIALLRYSHEAEQAIMDTTLGDPQRVSEAAVQVSLIRAREAAAEPAEQAKNAALVRAEEAEAAEASARFQALTQSGEAGELRNRLEVLEVREQTRADCIRARIDRRARLVASSLKFTAVILVLASLVVGVVAFFPDRFGWLPNWSLLGFKIASVIVLVFSSITLLVGRSVAEWIDGWRDSTITRQLREEGLEENREA